MLNWAEDIAPTGPRVEAIMQAVKAGITARQLGYGTRLPSVRAMAAAGRVSASTVVEAYARLEAEGLIRARRGSGFYIAAPAAPLSLEALGPKIERDIDPLWVSRQSLEAGTDMALPGCGWLPASWMPQEAIAKALRQVARAGGATLTDYGSPLGLPALREVLSRRLEARGIAASPAQIILTGSGTESLDLVCRFLIEPGDCVMVDDPCYFNFRALLRAHRAKVIGVPYTANGPDVAAFTELVAAHQPRLYMTNAGLHNPTGARLSAVNAHKILKVAESSGLIIIEDDLFADFEPAPAPRLAAFDGLERVISIGSFSKTLSASMRCGYIATRMAWVEPLLDLKTAIAFGSSPLTQHVVLNVLTDGSYKRHMDMLRPRLAKAMAQAAQRLQQVGIRPWLMPEGGLFLWCALPEGFEAEAIARCCLDEGVVLAPGNVFSVNQRAGAFMRFNVAQMNDRRVFTALERALRRT